MTFNTVLGLVGGLASAIMTGLTLLVSWYPNFRFERSLVRKLYTEFQEEGDKISNPADIKSRLKKQKPFLYNMKELMCEQLINILTCCGCCRCLLCGTAK